MITNFLKRPFGFVLISWLCSLLIRGSLMGLLWPLLFTALYTFFFYKERFTSSFKLKAALYEWLLVTGALMFMGFIIKMGLTVGLVKTAVLQNLDPNILMLFENFGMGGTMVIGYVCMTAILPLLFLYEYCMYSLGNKLGMWFIRLNAKSEDIQ